MTKSNSQFSPLHYRSDYEVPEEEEAQTHESLATSLRGISETTFKDFDHATRSVHSKSHGLLIGELQVLDGLPTYLAQGIFAKMVTYPLVIRISTILGDKLDDNVSTPCGLAVKVVGVEGERLMGTENAVTQDFVLVNGPAFLTSGPRQFLSKLKLLAATTDKVPALKKVLSTVLQGTENLIEAVDGKSAAHKILGGHPETNILSETYFSQAPIMYGDYMAKISIAPLSNSLIQLTNMPVDSADKPNGLREAVVEFFANNTAQWELRVQLCTDLQTMPIEDASMVWPEDLSPYVTVARITTKPQQAWSDARSKAIDDEMSFSPWHGIEAHRPIGSIVRVRKMAYEMSAKFRAEYNKVSMVEPAGLQDFPI